MAIPKEYEEYVKLKLARSFWQSKAETDVAYIISNYYGDSQSVPQSLYLVEFLDNGEVSQSDVKLYKDGDKVTFAITAFSYALKFNKKRFDKISKSIDGALIVNDDGRIELNAVHDFSDDIDPESIPQQLTACFEQLRRDADSPVYLRGARTKEPAIRFALQLMYGSLHNLPDAIKVGEYKATPYLGLPAEDFAAKCICGYRVNAIFGKQSGLITVPLDAATLASPMFRSFTWGDALWSDVVADACVGGQQVVHITVSLLTDGYQNVYLNVYDLSGTQRVRLLVHNAFCANIDSPRYEHAKNPPAKPAESTDVPTDNPAVKPYDVYVFDTNAILTTPKLVPTFIDKGVRFVVPFMVMHELNKRRSNADLSPNDKKTAEAALLNVVNADPEICNIVRFNKYDDANLPEELRTPTPDSLIIGIAIRYAKANNKKSRKRVALVTCDKGIISTCESLLTGNLKIDTISPKDALLTIKTPKPNDSVQEMRN